MQTIQITNGQGQESPRIPFEFQGISRNLKESSMLKCLANDASTRDACINVASLPRIRISTDVMEPQNNCIKRYIQGTLGLLRNVSVV